MKYEHYVNHNLTTLENVNYYYYSIIKLTMPPAACGGYANIKSRPLGFKSSAAHHRISFYFPPALSSKTEHGIHDGKLYFEL